MLLSIRAGRATRPGAAIGKLATRRAHRLPERVISWPATRWQTYATKTTAVPEHDSSFTTADPLSTLPCDYVDSLR